MQCTAVIVSTDNTMRSVTILGPKVDIATLYTACGFRTNRSFTLISEWPTANDSIQLWGKNTGVPNSKNIELSDYVKEPVYGRSIFIRVNPNTENIINTDEKQIRAAVGMQTAEDEEEEEEEEDIQEEAAEDDDDEREDDDEDDEDDEDGKKDEDDDDTDIGSVPIICPDKELCEEDYLPYSDEDCAK